MTTGILTVDGSQAPRYRDRVREVYAEAFGAIPDADVWDREVWDRHRRRPGYRLAVAVDDGTVLGFAWGYTGLRGQTYADLFAEVLGDRADDWVGGHFEFVELAVRASARGRGLGRRVHDALLEGLAHDRALLLTDDAETPAASLYRSAGWHRLAGFRPGTQLMGRRLRR